jgi:hypothetical protein
LLPGGADHLRDFSKRRSRVILLHAISPSRLHSPHITRHVPRTTYHAPPRIERQFMSWVWGMYAFVCGSKRFDNPRAEPAAAWRVDRSHAIRIGKPGTRT